MHVYYIRATPRNRGDVSEERIAPLVDYYNSLNLSYEPCISVLQSYSIENIPYNLFDLFDPYTDVLWGNGIPKPIFEIHDIIYHPADVKILGANKRTLKINDAGIKSIKDLKEVINNG